MNGAGVAATAWWATTGTGFSTTTGRSTITNELFLKRLVETWLNCSLIVVFVFNIPTCVCTTGTLTWTGYGCGTDTINIKRISELLLLAKKMNLPCFTTGYGANQNEEQFN